MTLQSERLTGSAPIQGKLWGSRARDWAEIQEQQTLSLQGAVLDAAHVTRGTRLLDAGCGAGLTALLASLRGADVSAFDASEALMEIARQRLPDADIRHADLESLPYDDATFDAAIAVNSLFYAADPSAALHEFVRVTRPTGRVVVTTWGPEEKCDQSHAMAATGALLPPQPLGRKPGGPFAFAEPGALEAVLEDAGLHPVDRGECSCPFVFLDSETSIAGQFSSGVTQRAIAHSGLERVRAALEEVDARFTQPDGSIRYENVFVWVAAVR